jgi:hypothetical protein
MRIHSDSLESLDLRKAATMAAVDFTRFDLKGSRSRAQAFDVILTGDSGRQQNGGGDEAASWDQWGIFLGHLFRLDQHLKTPYYDDAEHFVWMTGGRFTPEFGPGDCHRRHKWGWGHPNATGAYSVVECEGSARNPGCGAINRWMLHGRTFADLNR